MPKFVDLTGRSFGTWTVLRIADRWIGITKWFCRCVCGIERAVRAGHLCNGSSTNCGCQRTRLVTHGHTVGGRAKFSGAYRAWRSMRARCATDPYYKHVKICDRWDDFTNFLSDMGDRPQGMSLDRHPKRDGDYEPSNCRWATQKQQVEHLPQNQRGYKHKTRHGELRV